MVVVGDVGSWCRGDGLVVPGLFGYFLMGLWLGFGWFVVGYLLGLWWVFGWFVAWYLLSLWLVWGHGGSYVEVWLRERVGGGVVKRVTEIREK